MQGALRDTDAVSELDIRFPTYFVMPRRFAFLFGTRKHYDEALTSQAPAGPLR